MKESEEFAKSHLRDEKDLESLMDAIGRNTVLSAQSQRKTILLESGITVSGYKPNSIDNEPLTPSGARGYEFKSETDPEEFLRLARSCGYKH